jgi:hypothetical protein
MWPFPDNIRDYMRMASYWSGLGWSVQQILDWARGSRHNYNMVDMEMAAPEGARATYFANFVRNHDWHTPLSTLWGWAARGAWYAGYGRAPTAAELEWAYQHGPGSAGLFLVIEGRTVNTRQSRRYTITANVPWGSNFWDIGVEVRRMVAEGELFAEGGDTDALDPTTVSVQLGGGVLIQRQTPTITL